MDIGIFPAAAMPQIHAKLKHLETIRNYIFTKSSIVFSIRFGFGGQIKKY
jgi:hypothetical protein